MKAIFHLVGGMWAICRTKPCPLKSPLYLEHSCFFSFSFFFVVLVIDSREWWEEKRLTCDKASQNKPHTLTLTHSTVTLWTSSPTLGSLSLRLWCRLRFTLVHELYVINKPVKWTKSSSSLPWSFVSSDHLPPCVRVTGKELHTSNTFLCDVTPQSLNYLHLSVTIIDAPSSPELRLNYQN